jgi:hypothetical protein
MCTEEAELQLGHYHNCIKQNQNQDRSDICFFQAVVIQRRFEQNFCVDTNLIVKLL